MRIPNRRLNQTSKHKQKGVVAIEFALGFMAFWLMCMAWVEMSYMSYVSAICDVKISQAARQAKKVDFGGSASGSTAAYLSTFRGVITDNDSIWSGVVDNTKFKTSVTYLSSVNGLVTQTARCLPATGQNSATCGNAKDSPIAIYSISYDFNSIFSFFIDNTTFAREVIVIQEYEL